MKVTKTAVYRITASTSCGCASVREYEDADYKKPLADLKFGVCSKHKDQPGVDLIEMILGELVEKDADDHVAAPATSIRPNAAATVNSEGELEMRVPIQTAPVGRTSVRPSGTANRPATTASGGRTGPQKTYVRPTAPVRSGAASGGLADVLSEEEDSGDFLDQNDPEKAY